MPAQFYLLFKRVEVQGANAISSPLTYGFPALSGFLGAVHALHRQLNPSNEIELGGVLVSCHECVAHTYQEQHFKDKTFNLTRNPLNKQGAVAPIVEEGKVDLLVDLVVEVRTSRATWQKLRDSEYAREWCLGMGETLQTLRVAGGSVFAINDVKLFEASREEDKLKSEILPGFVLMSAHEEMSDIQKEWSISALDVLLETVMTHTYPPDESHDERYYKTVKQGRGWLVPLPLGYRAISENYKPGEMENIRSLQYESQFVEAVYGLGKWVFPLRLPEDLAQCFWKYSSPNNGLYLIEQV